MEETWLLDISKAILFHYLNKRLSMKDRQKNNIKRALTDLKKIKIYDREWKKRVEQSDEIVDIAEEILGFNERTKTKSINSRSNA